MIAYHPQRFNSVFGCVIGLLMILGAAPEDLGHTRSSSRLEVPPAEEADALVPAFRELMDSAAPAKADYRALRASAGFGPLLRAAEEEVPPERRGSVWACVLDLFQVFCTRLI